MAFAQVTTSVISGVVSDDKGEGLVGATVVATHVPSGTRYGSSTNASGRYNLPAVRVGGPFTITVTYTGFEPQTTEGIYTTLGSAANVDFTMKESGALIDEIVVTALRNDIFSSDRTGAASNFDRKVVTSLPTLGARSINDVTKYNANGNGRSFGAQDSRLNNFTIDGSVFNNGFGLGNSAQAGGRTGSTPISLDAIEEVQVNVAPFDVRQSGFVGSGINAVTRSGTNEFSGSVYYNFRNNGNAFTGRKVDGKDISVGEFDEKIIGGRLGGALIKNKLFFFVSGEVQQRTDLATPWVASGSSNTGQVTRVSKTDLDNLSNFLREKFNYETGPYEAFNNELSSSKFLGRLDYNLNDKNRLTLRYTHHDSWSDIPISNSSSLGAGSRTLRFDAMSYQNSGYIIEDNTRSFVAELNSSIGSRLHNNFIVGYDKQIEDRRYKGAFFPTIDIREGGSTYISAGFDPFTPDNKLNYGTFHVTNNLSLYMDKHTLTFGANYERYQSNNLFFPGNNGVYIFNSLADFYSAANFALDNPTADTSNVRIARFQYRYSALDGRAAPLQVLKAQKFDLYGQDEFQVTKRLKVLTGVRASVIGFGGTEALRNDVVARRKFLNQEGDSITLNTAQMPETKILWEPRIGFNWDVTGKKKTQLRGGTGIFTGRPPYVWVSNQVGNNGILTGFIDENKTGGSNRFGFTTDPSRFTPATASSPTIEIAATDPEYRFPQIWKTNLAVDQKLPLGFIGTVELLYNQNINAALYYNANQRNTTATFTAGPDRRARWVGGSRIYNDVSSAVVLTNTNEGYYAGATFKLEYPANKGLFGMVAYTYSEAKDLMSAGSIAFGSWQGAKSLGNNNQLTLSPSDFDLPHRAVGYLGYRIEYGGKRGGATSLTLGYEGFQSGRFSYFSAGDLNGDGAFDNELLYVPSNGNEIRFQSLTVRQPDNVTNVTFTPEQQQAAFEAFIAQDPYLSGRRGQYAERNASLLPWLHRFDLSAVQEIFVNVGGKRNTLQFRADILNVGNLVNDAWGVGQFATPNVINFRTVNSSGVPEFRMSTQVLEDGSIGLLKDTFQKRRAVSEVWTLQLGLRYIFN
jgi:hypothetical protein